MPIFLLKYWKHIVIILAVLVSGFFIYNHIYNRGYREAEAVYLAKIKDYEDKVEKKINEIKITSENLAIEIQRSTEETNKNIISISKSIKTKPIFTIVGGKCDLTPEFKGAVNSIIEEANRKKK
ncbi:MAG TPA: hypothetical protein V6C58_16870 [Allocoleopsis sp.]